MSYLLGNGHFRDFDLREDQALLADVDGLGARYASEDIEDLCFAKGWELRE